MPNPHTYKSLALASCASLILLAACGGGSSSGGPAATTLSGVAASGAAFNAGTITVTDSTGTVVGTSTSIADDGSFSVTLAANAKAPFVVTASRTAADGAVESLVSVVPSASTTTVNITPITSLIAARLSPSGDPSKLATELAAGTATITPSTVASTVSDVKTMLAPILTATGTTNVDPLTANFSANGTGYDRLLDSVKISITPASSSSSNIEVGIKQATADNAAPVAVQFSSQTPVASVPALPTITASNLVASGTSALIAQHLAQLTNCLALPTSSRVNVAVSNGVAVGSASNVVADACKNAFFGNDPTGFLSNGKTVGSSGAFASLFKDAATGTVYSQGSYEFTRGNGDLVVGYKARDASGNETFDTFVVRLDSDNKLKQIGNQYAYGGGVNPYHQLRDFINRTNDGYYSTGYNLSIPLNSAYDHVLVTTPTGNQVVMVRGSDGMVFPKLNSSRSPVDSNGNPTSNYATMAPSGTNFIRIRSEYADSSNAALHPSARESGLFFVPSDVSDSAIAAMGNQSKWQLDYFNGATQVATQTYRTRTRALTLAELRTRSWANLDSTTISSISSRFDSNTGKTSLPASNNVNPAWVVPSGALPPTQVTLFGKGHVVPATTPASFTAFNDAVNVGSTLRQVTIPCVDGSGETHCANPGPGYATFSVATGVHLWAQDTTGRQFAHYYAPYLMP